MCSSWMCLREVGKSVGATAQRYATCGDEQQAEDGCGHAQSRWCAAPSLASCSYHSDAVTLSNASRALREQIGEQPWSTPGSSVKCQVRVVESMRETSIYKACAKRPFTKHARNVPTTRT